MKKLLLVLAALSMSAGGAVAATAANPPTPAQKASFLAQCLKNSGDNSTLCTRKAEQVMKLADEPFMEVILATMKGGTLPVEQSKPYGIYVSKSNAVCAPGM